MACPCCPLSRRVCRPPFSPPSPVHVCLYANPHQEDFLNFDDDGADAGRRGSLNSPLPPFSSLSPR